MPQRTLASEWICYENAVIKMRRDPHPELRAESFEAFVGGMYAMFRIFTVDIATQSQEAQRTAINDLHDQIRALALQAGRK